MKRFSAAIVLTGVVCLAGCGDRVDPTVPAPDADAVGDSRSTSAQVDLAVAPVQMTADEVQQPVVAVTTCNLERISGHLFTAEPIQLSKSDTAPRLSGWVADMENGRVPDMAYVRLLARPDGGMWQLPVEPGAQRADVHALLGGGSGLERAGFGVNVDVAGMPEGTYRLFLAFAGEGGIRTCDNGRAVVVTSD